MTSTNDTKLILDKGIWILKMEYTPDRIHLEDPIEINQCFKCLEFGHLIQQCQSTISYCSKCAGKHPYRSCNSNHIKCKLCTQEHIAVSWTCPARKSYIKQKIDEKRDQRIKDKNNSNVAATPLNPTQPLSNSQPSIPSSSKTPLSFASSISSQFPPLKINSSQFLQTSKPTQPQPQPQNQLQNSTPPTQPTSITNSLQSSQQIQNNNSNNFNPLPTHVLEVQISIMKTYAKMKAKGDPEKYLDIMNNFIEQNGIPRIPPQINTTNTQKSNKLNTMQQGTNTNATTTIQQGTNTNVDTTQQGTNTNTCIMQQQGTNTNINSYASVCTSPTRPEIIVMDSLQSLSPIPGTPTQDIPQTQESTFNLQLSPTSSTNPEESPETSINSDDSVDIEDLEQEQLLTPKPKEHPQANSNESEPETTHQTNLYRCPSSPNIHTHTSHIIVPPPPMPIRSTTLSSSTPQLSVKPKNNRSPYLFRNASTSSQSDN